MSRSQYQLDAPYHSLLRPLNNSPLHHRACRTRAEFRSQPQPRPPKFRHYSAALGRPSEWSQHGRTMIPRPRGRRDHYRFPPALQPWAATYTTHPMPNRPRRPRGDSARSTSSASRYPSRLPRPYQHLPRCPGRRLTARAPLVAECPMASAIARGAASQLHTTALSRRSRHRRGRPWPVPPSATPSTAARSTRPRVPRASTIAPVRT